MRHTVTAIALAATAALLLPACGGQHTHHHPAVTAAALTQAEHAALPVMERCVPNGKAVIPAVLDGKASVMTDTQLAESFRAHASRQRILSCAIGAEGSTKQAVKSAEKEALTRAENCTLTAARRNGIGRGDGGKDVTAALGCAAQGAASVKAAATAAAAAGAK